MGYVKRAGNKFQLEAIIIKNKKKSSNWLVHELILYSVTALVCSLFCYYPYWFSCVCSLIQQLPYFWSCLFTPKCLFIVANFIVVFLILGESQSPSKSSSSSSNNPASQYYDEYMARSRKARSAISSSSSVSNITSVQERKTEIGTLSKELMIIKEQEDHKEVVDDDQVKKDDHEEEEEEEADLQRS